MVSPTLSGLIVDLFYLKSLSLEVIFSSRLEMWYEALAMLVLLAVSLLLADCAQRVWGSGCLSVRLCPCVSCGSDCRLLASL